MTVIHTERGPVEYAESGNGPPILYFHGTGITCHGMLPVEAPLAESGFRVIIPNRPGYGETPLGDHRTATACASVAASLLDALDVESACVMGSSGGAAFATSFAIHQSERTACLVLLCPQLHRWSDKTWLPDHSRWTLPFLRNRLLRKILLKLYAIQFPRMSADQFLKLESGSRYDGVHNDPVAQDLCRDSLTAMTHGLIHPGFENDFMVFTNEDIVSDGSRVGVSTLVLYDECDPIAPVAHVDWFASTLPDCKCVSLHTAGHLVWVGPDAGVMHESRVSFMMDHTETAA